MNKSTISDPQRGDWQQQIEELQKQSYKAFLEVDIERLKLLWSEDLVLNSPINRVHTRSQVLDLLQKGLIRHLSYEEHIELTTRHGDIVIVMGHDVVTDAPSAPPLKRRFTNIWSAAGGSWQLIARHANAIREG